jgi:hypothetical protein
LDDAAKKYRELGKAGDTVSQAQITTALAGKMKARTHSNMRISIL